MPALEVPLVVEVAGEEEVAAPLAAMAHNTLNQTK